MHYVPETAYFHLFLIFGLFFGVINGIHRILFKFGMNFDYSMQQSPILKTYWDELGKRAINSSFKIFKNFYKQTEATSSNGGSTGPKNSEFHNRSQIILGAIGVSLASAMLYETHTHNARTYQTEIDKIKQEDKRLDLEDERLKQKREKLENKIAKQRYKNESLLETQLKEGRISEDLYYKRREDLYKQK